MIKSRRLSLSATAGCALLVIGLMTHRAAPANGQDAGGSGSGIRVMVNGAPVRFEGQQPTMVRGSVLVPLRGVFEALGARVSWNPADESVTARRNGKTVRLRVGTADASVNGQPVSLSVPAQMYAGHVLVPLRFVSEAMGAQVGWMDATQTVTIRTNGEEASSGGGSNEGAGPPQQPDAQAIFVQYCGRCHTIGALGRGRIALDHTGAEHSQDWLEVQIRSPEQHGSRMPAFPPSRLSDRDLHVLSAYLETLK